MPGLSRPGAAGRAEPALVAAPGRDVAITAVVVALTACAFAAAGDHQTLATIQRLDDAWLRHLPGHDKAEHVNWRGSART